jgi:hypothetical protein
MEINPSKATLQNVKTMPDAATAKPAAVSDSLRTNGRGSQKGHKPAGFRFIAYRTTWSQSLTVETSGWIAVSLEKVAVVGTFRKLIWETFPMLTVCETGKRSKFHNN